MLMFQILNAEFQILDIFVSERKVGEEIGRSNKSLPCPSQSNAKCQMRNMLSIPLSTSCGVRSQEGA